MKILVVTDDFYPDMGGRQRVIYEVAKRLVREGHDIHVLTVQTNPTQTRYQEIEGIKIHRFLVDSNLKPIKFFSLFFRTKKEFENLLNVNNFNMVHLHNGATGFGVLLSKVSKDKKIIYTFYGPWHKEYKAQWGLILSKKENYIKKLLKGFLMSVFYHIMIFIQRRIFKRSNKIICLSKFSEQEIRKISSDLSEDKICLIPGGADTGKLFPLKDKYLTRKLLRLPEDKFIILTIRRLESRMGIDVLLKAMAKISPMKRSNLLLLIGGKGHLENFLKKFSKDLSIEKNVQFLGFIPDEQLSFYYQASDLFVLPSTSLEGFGLVIVEALACGLPVLGADSGAIPEVLCRFGEKFIFPAGNSDALANRIICFSENELNKLDLIYEDMASLVRKKYSWDVISSKYEKLYRKLYEKNAD